MAAPLTALLVALAVWTWPRRPERVRLMPGRSGDVDGAAGGAALGRRSHPSPGALLGRPLGALAGRLFARVRRRAAGPPVSGGDLPPDLLMELVASGLRSGLSVVDALQCAASVGVEPQSERTGGSAWGRPASSIAAQGVSPSDDDAGATAYLRQVVHRMRLGVPAEAAWASPPTALEPLARAMVLAELAGAPAAAVVARAAVDTRTLARERVELAAARLGVQLVLPLGLAVLPGFVLLSVVPIVLGLATSVLGLGA